MFSIMRGKSYSINGFNPLPVSQCFPVNPRLQVHLYLRSGSIAQVPLIHGFFIHGVISQLAPLNPGGQRQRRYPRLFTHIPLLLQPCWAQKSMGCSQRRPTSGGVKNIKWLKELRPLCSQRKTFLFELQVLYP